MVLLKSDFSLFIPCCWIAEEWIASGCDRCRWLIRGLSVVKLRFAYRWERQEENDYEQAGINIVKAFGIKLAFS